MGMGWSKHYEMLSDKRYIVTLITKSGGTSYMLKFDLSCPSHLKGIITMHFDRLV